MLDRHNRHCAQTEALIVLLKERARNLYLTRQLLCAEAVLVTLNQGLSGGLSDAQAIAMAAPFSIALGESGCLCGALSGAIHGVGKIPGEWIEGVNRESVNRFRSVAQKMTNLISTGASSSKARAEMILRLSETS